MADEADAGKGAEGTGAEGQGQPAAEPSADVAALRALVESQSAQLKALNDTVNGALTRRQSYAAPGGDAVGGKDGIPVVQVTQQLRQALRNRGMSDATIDYNAPFILPFVEIFAPELVSLVESRVSGVDERLTLREMESDDENFPFAKPLRAEIKKAVADAKKDGRPLSYEAAYHTAVSLDVAKGTESKVRQAEASRRAESQGADATATAGLGHRTSSGIGARGAKPAPPRTAADLSKMSREERAKFYEQAGDLPIQ